MPVCCSPLQPVPDYNSGSSLNAFRNITSKVITPPNTCIACNPKMIYKNCPALILPSSLLIIQLLKRQGSATQ